MSHVKLSAPCAVRAPRRRLLQAIKLPMLRDALALVADHHGVPCDVRAVDGAFEELQPEEQVPA